MRQAQEGEEGQEDKEASPLTLSRPRSKPESVARDEVDDFQRARIVCAMVEVAAELGYIGAAVAPVVARASVSRRTFYELFDGREDCFLAAFDWGVEQARGAMGEAYASQRSWRERVRHALAALLVLLDSEPELARVCVIEALGAGKLVLARRGQLAEELGAALSAGAPPSRVGAAALPSLTAEGAIGGAFAVIHSRLLEQSNHVVEGARARGVPQAEGLALDHSASIATQGGREEVSLIALHGQLMALISLPYLGPRVAAEELTRLAPQSPSRHPVNPGEDEERGRLLERLDMRLTYRTVRCLTFIGEHPGSSNREIAKGAEVPDEGQASKLLARLATLELIANSRPAGPGFPNCWMLTPRGVQVLSAVRRH
jgi:AcrR family transcriptional regulator